MKPENLELAPAPPGPGDEQPRPRNAEARPGAASDDVPKRRVTYLANVTDGTGQKAEFRATYDVDAAMLAAAVAPQPDLEACRLIIRSLSVASTDAMLRLRPWRCAGCGGAEPARVLSNVASWLHVPPPDGPMLFDTAFPYCTRNGKACEAACRREAAVLHADCKAAMPDFPEHSMF